MKFIYIVISLLEVCTCLPYSSKNHLDSRKYENNTILDHLDFLGEKMPAIICSIQTKNKTTTSTQITEM